MTVAQPAGLQGWRAETHLAAQIAGRAVLACRGTAQGESVQVAEDAVEAALVCPDCRRLWVQVRAQQRPEA